MQKSEQPLPGTLAAFAFAIVALTYVVNAMDRIVFPVLLPRVIHEYGFSLSVGGLLATIFTLGLGLTGIPGGYLFDRMSRKSITIIGILIYSVCTMLTCVSVGFYDMALYRAVSGIGEALQNAAIFTMAGAYFFRNRTLAFGVLNTGYGVGSFIGPRWAVHLLGPNGDWHHPLYVYGIIGLVGAVVFFIFVPKRFSERHADISQKEADERHIPDRLINRNTIIVSIVAICNGMATFGYIGLYPTFLMTALHFTPHDAGAATSMFGIGAIMGIVCGYLADRINQKTMTLVAIVIFAATGYALFNLVTTPLAHDILSFIDGTAASGFMYVNNYSLMQRSVTAKRVGRASGLVITFVYLPAAFSGLIFAKLKLALGWGDAAAIQLCLQLGIAFIAMLFFKIEQTSCPKGGGAATSLQEPVIL